MIRRLAPLAILFGLAAGADETPTKTGPTDPGAGLRAESAEALRREFRAVCEAAKASSDPYYGTAQITKLEGYLGQPVAGALPRALVRARLGLERLRWGRNAEAVRLLGEARTIAEDGELDLALRQDILRHLALAHLRLGEQANCVDGHNPDSCILPLTRGGIHADTRGALTAVSLYREYLEKDPGQPVVLWLMNVAAMAAGKPEALPEELRVPAERLRSAHDVRRFPNVAAQRGLHIFQPSGGGIMDDFDGDGLLDIVSSTIDPCQPMHFFRNDGRGGFENRAARSGLALQLGGLNTVHADYDDDGDLDLLVLRGGWMASAGRMRNSLLRNNGDGTFDDVTRAAGLAEPAYPTQTANWSDYDNDGDLDVYIGNEIDDEGRAFPSQLFRNNGDGTFTDVATAAGVRNERMAKSVGWGDYDNDGDPDLYVSNLGPNRLYRNDGDGTFTDVAPALGVAEPEGRSFPAWFFDYDNDGQLDIFVADYGARHEHVAGYYMGLAGTGGHPLLYRNLGQGRFREVSREVGLDIPCLPMGSNYGDLDNDGFLDVYLGTGTPSYESIAPNVMLRNDRGERFQDVSFSGGFAHLQKGHGVAFGDLDGDGDQDVFEQMGGAYPGDAYPSALYLNPGHGNAWVTLRLRGKTSNHFGIGARIHLRVRDAEGGAQDIYRTVGSGGSFGGSTLQQEIGLGRATTIERLEVFWPTSGTRQSFANIAVNRTYVIHEDSGEPRPVGP